MTLEEAIKRAEEVAEEQEKAAKEWHENQVRKCELVPFAEMDYTHENECKECASEHRQLAEWLKELKDYRERIPSYEAGYNDAKREIALSGEYQRAYERGKQDAEQTQWIPASERLPKVMKGANGECSDDILICVADDEQITISTGFYGYYPRSASQQGWWSMWAYGCHQLGSKYKVIAWMPLPAPFEPQESEE